MAAHTSDTTWRGRALVPVLVYVGTVVAVISSLGAPLIPTIAGADHVPLSEAQWSLTVTLLVGAVATPTMGRLGDGPLRRPTILGALSFVLVGSALAALPFGFVWLVVGRAFQGVGLGLIPLTIATARDNLPAERSRSVIALLSITTVTGVGLGYPLTGLITQVFGFHASFWFGAAVSGIALISAVVVLPHTRHLAPRRLDAVGAILFGAVLGGLLLALSEGESWGWTSPTLISVCAASLACLAVWIVYELRTGQPLVDLRQLRNRVVLTADLMGLVAGMGMYLLLSLVTRLAQTPAGPAHGFGVSVVVAGLILLPFSAGSLSASRAVPLVAQRLSWRLTLPLSCGVILLSMLWFGLNRSGLWELFVVMGVAGLGVGCVFALVPGLVVNSVPAREVGSAIGFNQVLRYVGFATGSALSAAVLESHTRVGAVLPDPVGYRFAAVLGCAICAAGAVTAIVLPGRRRSQPDVPVDGGEAPTVGMPVRKGQEPADRSMETTG
ncbi:MULTISPECIES: MFS transporter [unclassified Streptomyces]|uniref:MFS transporter n=1 Tax=unclassified Streptomyces TaxID=2593676 RepID=UPI003D8B3015